MTSQPSTKKNNFFADVHIPTVIGGAFGAIVGLIGGATFSLTIEACSTLRNTDLAQWIGGIGAALAAFIAVGVGIFQHTQARSLWKKSNEVRNSDKREHEIRSAHLVCGQIEILYQSIELFMPFIQNINGRNEPAERAQSYIRRVVDMNFAILVEKSLLIPECNRKIVDAIREIIKIDLILHSSGYEQRKNDMIKCMGIAMSQLECAKKIMKGQYISD
ncbi:hypothetical protein [Insolitispirillum peregrinum]|uniref:Uncharacterized protein n=1 Tax=Insolitispirillum peregrinum TaxID=80876 RepID=A0A1N7LWD8_9PROT|nr:hypothetical protein [Insolitispirillum peregrinum]SIS78175.1 hypothetical protein SAMN05421779_103598 [Insolitispirillum peregrinum]